MSPEEGADTSGHCDERVAHFEKLIWRSSGFSVVGVVDSCGLDVSDVDFYEKVSELEALKVAKEGDHSNTLMGLRCHRQR